MGKPLVLARDVLRTRARILRGGRNLSASSWRLGAEREHTLGSKTFQYQEENITIVISLVAASEKEEAQTVRIT